MQTPIGQLDPAIRDVHIWGGGISGLLMGHALLARGFHVHLYEKSARLGGKLHSHQTPAGVVEEAAHAIFATPEMESRLRSLGLEVIPARPQLKRRLWDGQPRSPLSLGLIIRLPGLLKRTPAITDDTTVAEFFRPWLGEQVEAILTPALQGIYGCGAEQLTVTALWPNMRAGNYLQTLRQMKSPRARSVSFPGGMSELVVALAQGLDIQLSHAGPFVLRPNTVVCTDALSAAELVRDAWASGARALADIPYLPLASATVSTPTPSSGKDTFGFLFPRGAGIHALGVLFQKEIFPHRAGHTFILPLTGDVESRVAADQRRLGWAPSPGTMTFQWERALPRYDAARTRALKALHTDSTRPPGLVLFGNYVTGISLRAMAESAQQFASRH